MLADDSQRTVAGERGSAGHHLVQHDAQRVEVRALVELVAPYLLWRHVERCSDDYVRGCHAVGALRQGQAEISDPGRLVRGEPHVAGFKVPMYDAPRVSKHQSAADAQGDRQSLLQREPVILGVSQECI